MCHGREVLSRSLEYARIARLVYLPVLQKQLCFGVSGARASTGSRGCPRVSFVADALKGRSQADRRNPIDIQTDPNVRDRYGHHSSAMPSADAEAQGRGRSYWAPVYSVTVVAV